MKLNNCYFHNSEILPETVGIRKRCNKEYIESELKKSFSCGFSVSNVSINETGHYKKCKNLPPYCEIVIVRKEHECTEEFIIWSPLKWNDRFAGTAGGGEKTGGREFITPPDNMVRGWTLPFAVINGFTAATCDAKNISGLKDFMIDKKTGKFNRTLYDNWRTETTHRMTVIGKAVAEILHNRPVKYSYMNGGSGGGRQSLMEAQNYPLDYDGIWASCPAINWPKFLLVGLWYLAVMNTEHDILPPEKIKFFAQEARESVGSNKRYFTLKEKNNFDPYSVVGKSTKKGVIGFTDAKVMKMIWDGPIDEFGNRLWYGHRPGIRFWNVGIPVGGFYYSLISHKPKPFFLTTLYARWITENIKEKFEKITIPEFYRLFNSSISKFSDAMGDIADLCEFKAHGGKLIIDHGLNDPLIPVDGTINYYKTIQKAMGSDTDDFCKLYLNPGDGHGNCWSDGPGITETNGINALIEWVENNITPEGIKAVQIDKKSRRVLKETVTYPVKDIGEWE